MYIAWNPDLKFLGEREWGVGASENQHNCFGESESQFFFFSKKHLPPYLPTQYQLVAAAVTNYGAWQWNLILFCKWPIHRRFSKQSMFWEFHWWTVYPALFWVETMPFATNESEQYFHWWNWPLWLLWLFQEMKGGQYLVTMATDENVTEGVQGRYMYDVRQNLNSKAYTIKLLLIPSAHAWCHLPIRLANSNR